jgi:PAS domain S-box-containing protein
MSTTRILVVDDDRKNIQLIKGMLFQEKYEICDCLSGEEALESLNNFKPDLILLDILMPGINGFELCKKLKKDIRTRIIPIIMITALNERKDRKQALEAGAEDFLSKPLDKFELLARAKSLLRLKSYHDELITSHTEIAQKNEELVREIAERKRTEALFRKSEEKYRELVNHAPVGIYEVDIQESRFLNVNDVMCDYTGHTREEFLKLKPTDIFEKDGRKLFLETQQKIIQGKEVPEIQEYQIRCRNGSEFWAILNSKLACHQGRPNRITYVVNDISKLKQAEEEKKSLEEKLYKAQKMEAIGMLAGGVAHDLNNILSGVLSYPELLLMDMPRDDPYRKPIETIQESGKKAAAIVEDLLTMARRGVNVSEVINLNDIVSEYLISPEFEKLKSFHPMVEFKQDFNTGLLNIAGSSVHLSKTVMNLVSNAAEAMPDGGQLIIATKNQYVNQPINGYDDVHAGDYVLLMVSDTGTGISPEDLSRLFEPFFTKKVMGRSGTGLGMAVVWGTVQDHSGYIDVKSIEGQGTTITLYFPVTNKKVLEDKNKDCPIESYMGNGETILVVDDVEKQREIASSILSQLNYSVDTVACGEAAVEYIKRNETDLLVLDMIMDPGIDGLETYKEILKLKTEQKAVITSGFSETEKVKEAQRLGAVQYVKKPYTIKNIGVAIKSAFECDPSGI